MKIYFNKKPKYNIPYGGGNLFLINLIDYFKLNKTDFIPCFSPLLDVDVVFILDPRPQVDTGFCMEIVDLYKKAGKKIVMRVSDCGTHGKPHMINMYKYLIPLCDLVIFPSKWAISYLESCGVIINHKISFVIHNAPSSIFFNGRISRESRKTKYKIVTHHWSDNEKKGFDIYEYFDNLLIDEDMFEKFDFTFIGRKPNWIKFKRAQHYDPLFGIELVKKLSEHDLYLTASELEAGANHVQEAKAIGLPIVFAKNGGSIVEYCKDFGEMFDSKEDLLIALEKCVENFEIYRSNVLNFTYSSNVMCESYFKLIKKVLNK